jgi:hypothetical protein
VRGDTVKCSISTIKVIGNTDVKTSFSFCVNILILLHFLFFYYL